MKQFFGIILFSLWLILWLILILAMHLACFDLFGDNLWYCYVIAGVLLSLQFASIAGLHKLRKIKWVYLPCFVLYSFGGCIVIYFLASALAMHDPSPQGLAIWCLLLDIIGAVYCICKLKFLKK